MTAVPRLSVGLPVYNGEQYVSDALDAMLSQSYEDFERTQLSPSKAWSVVRKFR